MGNIKAYQSKKGGTWLTPLDDIGMEESTQKQEMKLIMVYDDITYQTVEGFGGAFTEAAAQTFFEMNESNQKLILEKLFDNTGLNYNCGRNAIGACDFSRGNFSYCDKDGDIELTSFSVDEDEAYVIPFLLKASEIRGEKLTMLSSPWSPPAWMKTNHQMTGGGKLKKEYYGVWADYFVKYIRAYEEKGIPISYVTVQNEPHAVQTWESCIYTAEEETEFITEHLYPKLLEAGLSHVKIIIWDHNKENVYLRAKQVFAQDKAKEAVAGMAFHWYSGDHFENLALCGEQFPGKELFFTEGCVELTTTATAMGDKANNGALNNKEADKAPYEFGECYGHDILGNLNHGMNWYMDWNLLLNKEGGPNHVGNYCSAPIICDTDQQEVIFQPSYYFISHFSRFLPKGSKRIAYSKYTDALEVGAFLTPDGGKVIIVMNTTERDIEFILQDANTQKSVALTAEKKSIATYLY